MKRFRGRLIALLCGLALWLFGVLFQGPPQASDTGEWVRVLSNGALVPGVLFVGISGMVWIAGEGLFDGVKYTLNSMMTHIRGGQKKYATYYDYIHRDKRERPAYPMLLPGLFFLAAAVVLTLLYELQR